MMIKDLHENDLGDMVGTFYSDVLGYEVEVMYDKDISQEYVEKNIEYFNHLDQKFLEEICAALKRFFDDYYEMNSDLSDHISEELLENYEQNPMSILNYIDIGVYFFARCSAENEDIPVIDISGDCEWDGDQQVTIKAKDNRLVYVGPFSDTDVWNEKAITKYEMYNYAVPMSDG